MNPITFFAAAISERIDAEAGILFGVSVITEGEAKGHGMLIDSTTLSQVAACITAFGDDGVKVKVNHWSGFDGIVGALRNPRIDGNQLRADLHLLSTSDARARILEMAAEMPSQFGLSIAFSGAAEEIPLTDGQTATFARCSELYSVDLVDQPAANPTGLFAQPSEAELAFAHALGRIETLEGEKNELNARLEESVATFAALQNELNTAKEQLAQFKAREEALAANVAKLKSFAKLQPAEVVPQVVAHSQASADADLYEEFRKADPTKTALMFADPEKKARIIAESTRRQEAVRAAV